LNPEVVAAAVRRSPTAVLTAALPRKPSVLTVSGDARTAPPARAVITREEAGRLIGHRQQELVRTGLTQRQALERVADEFPDLYRAWAEWYRAWAE
jgi:hypothetical protein